MPIERFTRDRILCAFGTLVVASALCATGAHSQRQPLVMAHGIRSTAATWDTDSVLLQAAYPVVVKKISTQWTDSQTVQARYLRNTIFSGLPDSTLAVGHSNGGLVLRQAALDSAPMRGLMTIGTPNKGAPAATAVISGAMAGITGPVAYDVSGFIATYSFNTFDWEELYYAQLLTINVTAILNIIVNEVLANNGFDSNSDVWRGLYPSSPYLQGLNSSSSLQQQAQRITRRAAVVSQIDHPEWALYRLRYSESQSEDWSVNVDLTAASLFIGGWYFADRFCGYPNFDSSRCLAGLFMSDAGYQLQRMPSRYCALAQIEGVNEWDGLGAYCEPGDAVVPYQNQVWSDTIFAKTYLVAGASHSEETRDPAVLAAIKLFLGEQNSIKPCGAGPVFTISFSPPSGELRVGNTKNMPLIRADRCTVPTTQGLPITVSSSNPAVATVGWSGGDVYVTGISPGTSQVTVWTGGLSYTRIVTVLPAILF